MFNKLAKEVYENAKNKGFWDDRLNIITKMEANPEFTPEEVKYIRGAIKGQMLMLIVSEVSEALEADRVDKYTNTIKHTIQTVPPEDEIWRTVEDYSDYEVSNLGNIRSLDMKVWNGKTYYTKDGRLLSPGLGGNGYYTVSLRGDSKKRSILVAKAFCEGYDETKIVNHINGNKTDDYSTNLEWVSSSENNKHAIETGLKDMTKILSKEETTDIAFRCKNNEKHKDIHKDYPQVSLSRIKAISRTKSNYTETFEYELADTVIRILDLAHSEGIDIEKHIELKMKYNSFRPHKHGKKY